MLGPPSVRRGKRRTSSIKNSFHPSYLPGDISGRESHLSASSFPQLFSNIRQTNRLTTRTTATIRQLNSWNRVSISTNHLPHVAAFFFNIQNLNISICWKSCVCVRVSYLASRCRCGSRSAPLGTSSSSGRAPSFRSPPRRRSPDR